MILISGIFWRQRAVGCDELLHIIFMILKVIGCILLVLLALLLLALLCVLLVPIRYHLQGSGYGALKAKGQVTWLLHLVAIRFQYEEGFRASVKILGRTLQQIPQPEKPVQEEEKELILNAQELPAQERTEQAEDQPLDPDSAAQDVSADSAAREDISQKTDKPAEDDPSEEDITLDKPPLETKWLKSILLRPIEWLKTFWRKLKYSFRRICDTLKNIRTKYKEIRDFIQDETNKRTFAVIKKQLLAMLKHVLPQQISGKLRFGADDPSVTGQCLAAAGILLPWYRNRVEITPVFDEAVIEGELEIKGRIRLGTLMLRGIRVLLDKNFRVQLKRLLKYNAG